MINEVAPANNTRSLLYEYKRDVLRELESILEFWMRFCVDEKNGGFYGKVANDNIADVNAPKGLVLNARILWAFSAAFHINHDARHKATANRAFDYIMHNFCDDKFGGFYWMVNAGGKPYNTRKQIYALAFSLYGISEYYAAFKSSAALNKAIELFKTIEQYSCDKRRNGYFEAFSRDWGPLDDLRLSTKDANEKKTMNTHLHIIEAYCNLYNVWPDKLLREKITVLLEIFDSYFINKTTGHLELFFDEQWQVKPGVISYGHDIEASWLLQQCAEIISDNYWKSKMKLHAVTTAGAAMEGIDIDGGLWYEYVQDKKQLVKEKHWWPQAEAMVGFFNAWQVTRDERLLFQSYNSWQFIKKHIIAKNGEWYWGVTEHHVVMQGHDKAGFWKCPYHNARACMELIKRIDCALGTAPDKNYLC